MISWPEILETGYPEIDRDHRKLIDRCNALTQMVEERRPWNEIVDAFVHLGPELEAHFKSEEEILERTEFPRAAAHKLQHRHLQQDLAELTSSLRALDGSCSEHWSKISSIRETLLELLFRHDLDYKSHLQYSIGQ